MSKEIQVLSWCDLHREGSKTPATQEITINANHRSYTLDVCEQHGAEVEQQMREWASRGTLVPLGAGGGGSSQSTTCIICGLHSQSRSALGHHVRRKHNMGLKEMARTSGVPQDT